MLEEVGERRHPLGDVVIRGAQALVHQRHERRGDDGHAHGLEGDDRVAVVGAVAEGLVVHELALALDRQHDTGQLVLARVGRRPGLQLPQPLHVEALVLGDLLDRRELDVLVLLVSPRLEHGEGADGQQRQQAHDGVHAAARSPASAHAHHRLVDGDLAALRLLILGAARRGVPLAQLCAVPAIVFGVRVLLRVRAEDHPAGPVQSTSGRVNKSIAGYQRFESFHARPGRDGRAKMQRRDLSRRQVGLGLSAICRGTIKLGQETTNS